VLTVLTYFGMVYITQNADFVKWVIVIYIYIQENLPSEEAILHSSRFITLLLGPVTIRSVNHAYQMCIICYFVLHACYSNINLSTVLSLVSHAFY